MEGTTPDRFAIAKYAPYITTYLIFLGVVRLQFYYSNFGINIIPFLSFSEILTSFLDLLTIFILAVGLSILLASILVVLFYRMLHKRKSVIPAPEITGAEKTDDRKNWKFHRMVVSNLTYLAICNIGSTWIIDKEMPPQRVLNISLVYGGVCLGILLFYEIYIILFKAKINRQIRYTVLMVLTLIIGAILTGYIGELQANRTRENSSRSSVVLVLKDGPIITSNSNLFFVGKTEKYIFFYNKMSKITQVYGASEIKTLAFSSSEPTKKNPAQP